MVFEEIVTSLKNAVDHGESLENAIQLAINSGYNEKEVEEASHYVSNTTNYFKPKPDEQLSMPAEKSILSKNPLVKTQNKYFMQDTPIQQSLMPKQFREQIQNPINHQITQIRQDNNAIKQNISDGSVFTNSSEPSLYGELNKIKPIKEGYTKEILLIIILMLLIGVLISSFLFKDQILSLFQSL